jgi:hypothetical protein
VDQAKDCLQKQNKQSLLTIGVKGTTACVMVPLSSVESLFSSFCCRSRSLLKSFTKLRYSAL